MNCAGLEAEEVMLSKSRSSRLMWMCRVLGADGEGEERMWREWRRIWDVNL